ncbi:MAG: Mth938-like domain-containing protein [Rhodobacteraceae bacterium]|nr:Mth938-like domain-containing protein [Paracoccaceae bacterium]
MRLNEIQFGQGRPVDGYGPGFFRVGGAVVQGGVLLLPDVGATMWRGFEDLDPILAAADRIDVLFVGTGAQTAHLPAAMRQALEQAGIGAEPMASPAACRTYNILLSEGRRVGLAALPVPDAL